MEAKKKKEILRRFKAWFLDTLVVKHKANTEKLVDLHEFDINPFLLYYLAAYLEGDDRPESLAKVLVLPRVLGTSITTSFGTNIQKFITEVLGEYGAEGSIGSGLDIVFTDQIDNRTKYCQLKSGPNSLNRDDVKTVGDHFKRVKNLARTNNLDIGVQDLVFCLIYGAESEKNSFIRELEEDFVVYIGQDFWHRFTGDPDFYRDLINAAGDVAKEINMKQTVDDVITQISAKIEVHLKNITK